MRRGSLSLVVFIVALIGLITAQYPRPPLCLTTTGYYGYCIRIMDCEPIVMLLTRGPIEAADIAYMRANLCDKGSGIRKICCVPEKTAVDRKAHKSREH